MPPQGESALPSNAWVRPHLFSIWLDYKLFGYRLADIIRQPGVHTVDGIALANVRRTRIESLALAGDDHESTIQIPCPTLLKELGTIIRTQCDLGHIVTR